MLIHICILSVEINYSIESINSVSNFHIQESFEGLYEYLNPVIYEVFYF